MPVVVMLACLTCGAPLDVAPGAETLRCTYCHTAHRVDHANGHVSLAPLAERMDRVAAELAIPRLESEIRALDEEIRAIGENLRAAANESPDDVIPRTPVESVFPLATISLFAAIFIFASNWQPGAWLAAASLVAYWVWLSKVSGRRLANARKIIRDNEERIRESMARVKEQISDKQAKISSYRQMLNN